MTEYLKPKFSVALGNAKFSAGWEEVFGEMAKVRRLPKGIPGESPCPCPKCGADAPCTDRVEVDIGVGIQTGCHEYTCPEHGAFGWLVRDVRLPGRSRRVAPAAVSAGPRSVHEVLRDRPRVPVVRGQVAAVPALSRNRHGLVAFTR